MAFDALLNRSFYAALLFVLDGFDVEFLVALLPLSRNSRNPSAPVVRLDLGSLALRHGALRQGLLDTSSVWTYSSPCGQTVLQGLRGCFSHRLGLDEIVWMRALRGGETLRSDDHIDDLASSLGEGQGNGRILARGFLFLLENGALFGDWRVKTNPLPQLYDWEESEGLL